MAIVKMKRLRLLALRPDREELLRQLQSLGCVEIREPAIDLSAPEWEGLGKPDHSGLEKAREQSLLLNGALDILRRYAPAKELSVYDYSQVLFSAVLGFFLFHQVPDALSWLGYLVIFATALAMFFYNTRSAQAQ